MPQLRHLPAEDNGNVQAQNKLFFYCCFLRLRISRVEDNIVMVCWTTKLWKIKRIRQTTNLDCNHGNKPAVTFNCIIPRFLFSISQSCFPIASLPCLCAMFAPMWMMREKKTGKFKSFWGIWRWEWRCLCLIRKTTESSYLWIENICMQFVIRLSSPVSPRRFMSASAVSVKDKLDSL